MQGILRFAFVSFVAPVLAQVSTPAGASDVTHTSSRVPTCDTTYVGPPGGRWEDVNNWTTSLPRPSDVVCIPDDVVKSLPTA